MGEIDNAVRQVVKEHVDEALTELVDTKVQTAVVEQQTDLTYEKLKEVMMENDMTGCIEADEIEGLEGKIESAVEDITPESIGAAYDDHDHDDNEHEHDAYDTWVNIESYVEDAIDSKLSDHVDEHEHGGSGGHGKTVIDRIQLGSLLNLLGVSSSFTDGKLTSMSTGASGFGAWPMKPEQGLLGRLVKLEQQAAAGNVLGNGNIAADPRVDQLMAWAQHIDQVLKAASTSSVLEQKETV